MIKLIFALYNADNSPAINIPVTVNFTPKNPNGAEIIPREYVTDANGVFTDDNIPTDYNINITSTLIPNEEKDN